MRRSGFSGAGRWCCRLAAVSAVLLLTAAPAVANETPARDGRPATTFPAEIPLKRDPVPDEAASHDAIVWIGVLTLLVLMGLPLLRWGYRRTPKGRRPPALERWLGQGQGGDVRLLESVRLTERHSVHLVAWQRKRLLLACCDQAVTVIDRGEVDPSTLAGSPRETEGRTDAA